MPLPPDPLLLDRVLAGEASSADEAALRAWLAADPANEERLDALRAALASPAAVDAARPDTDAAWARLRARLPLEMPVHAPVEAPSDAPRPAPTSVPLRPTAPRVPARRPAWALGRQLGRRLAAGVLLTVGAVGLWRMLTPRAADTLTLGAPAGRRLVTTLPDGTRLVLNAGSRVRLAAGYGAGPDGARELTLDGEAYFAVVHDARHPFRVRAAGATVEDLGTRFAVRAYREDGRRVEVAVAEGRVALGVPAAGAEGPTSPPAPAVALEAGEVARVDAWGAVTRARADVARRLAWAEGDAGVLVLDDVPLGEAVAPLARWLDLDLRLGDSTLAARRVRARLTSPTAPGAPTGADALAALALALRVRAVRDGRTVTLLPVAP